MRHSLAALLLAASILAVPAAPGAFAQSDAAARALEPQARLLAGQLQQLNAQALALTQGLEERLTLAIAPELLAARWTEALAAR